MGIGEFLERIIFCAQHLEELEWALRWRSEAQLRQAVLEEVVGAICREEQHFLRASSRLDSRNGVLLSTLSHGCDAWSGHLSADELARRVVDIYYGVLEKLDQERGWGQFLEQKVSTLEEALRNRELPPTHELGQARDELARLRKQLKESESRLGSFQMQVNELKRQLGERDRCIAKLNRIIVAQQEQLNAMGRENV